MVLWWLSIDLGQCNTFQIGLQVLGSSKGLLDPVSDQSGFVTTLKGQIGAITAALSFIVLLASFVQSLSSQFRSVAIAIMAAASVLLFAYNVWIWRRYRRTDEAGVPEIGIKRRLVLHLLSGLAVVVAWSAAITLMSDYYAARFLPTLVCGFKVPMFARIAVPRLERYVAGDTSRDFAARLNLANCYDRAGRFVDEIDTLDKTLADPDSQSALGPARYAELSFMVGLDLLKPEYLETRPPQYDKAMNYLRAARHYGGPNPIKNVVLAYAIAKRYGRSAGPEQRQEITDLAADAQKWLQTEPPDRESIREVHYFYGLSLLLLAQPDSASQELNAALKGGQRGIMRDDILFALGENELENGHDLEARRTWSQIEDSETLANAAFSAALSFWSESETARDQGDTTRQKELLDKADHLLSAVESTGIESPRVHAGAGLIAMSHERYQEAISQFDAFVKGQPSSALGYHWLGKSLLSAKAYPKAKDAFSRAVELDPTNDDDWSLLGYSFIELGEWRKADSAFSEAVDKTPDNPLFLWSLLKTRVTLAEQEKDLETQAKLFGQILTLAERTIRAAEKADKADLANSARRTRAGAWNALAYFYTTRGEALSVAMDYINQALEGWPKDPVFLSTKAEILIKRAERQAASSPEREATLTQAETLLKSAFNDTIERQLAAEMWVDRGHIEVLRGHRDAANQDFLKAVNLDPTNAEAKRLAE